MEQFEYQISAFPDAPIRLNWIPWAFGFNVTASTKQLKLLPWPQHSPKPLDGITIAWDAEAVGLELRFILNVGTYSEDPAAPVSQPKFDAWENERLLVSKTISKQ